MIDLNELTVNKYSKEYILSKISNDDIIKHFYGKQITIGEAVPSPWRDDSTPSFAFYKNKGILTFYDFGTGVRGAAFDFVMNLFNTSFKGAVNIILSEFNLISNFKRTYSKPDTIYQKDIKEQERASIRFKIRQWNKDDILYWNSFGIKLNTLHKFKVYPISYLFMKEYTFKADKYAYVYIEKIQDSIYTKIYQPYSKKTKWLSNMPSKVLFGYRNIPQTGELIIITKALKEIMSLYDTCSIPSIGVQQENVIIKKHVLEDLHNRFTTIITMFDNDTQGIQLYNAYKELGIQGILFKEAKNYSDLIEKLGINKSKIIIKNKLNKL
jgi:hypothetical protein